MRCPICAKMLVRGMGCMHFSSGYDYKVFYDHMPNGIMMTAIYSFKDPMWGKLVMELEGFVGMTEEKIEGLMALR